MFLLWAILAAAGLSGLAGLADRIMDKGGIWEQSLVACERAGVKLTLHRQPAHKFRITIESRCQGDKQRLAFDGTWEVEEPATVRLLLKQEEGPPEKMNCLLSESGETLVCGDEDVTFTLAAKKR